MIVTWRLAWLGLGLLAALGCSPAEGEEAGEASAASVERLNEESRRRADVVVTWNLHAQEAMRVEAIQSLVQSRVNAMVHIAMHDAANAVWRRYKGYAFKGRARGRASAAAAAAAAAHGVLAQLFPRQRDVIDGWLAQSLAGISGSNRAKQRGVEVGGQAAAAIIAMRQDDGWNGAAPYRPVAGPGIWQPTPPAMVPAVGPHWRFVAPWVLDSGSQFRAGPPPALTSRQYQREYDEVKAVGRDTSTTRTADESSRVDFFFEGHHITVNTIVRAITAEKRLDLWEAARLLALVNLGVADAYIAGFDSKYAYNYWRPVTAIRAAAGDGNDGTRAVPGWNSFRPTPAHPDYPSTHSVSGGAAEAIILRFFHSEDSFHLTFTTSTARPPGSTRTYHSIRRLEADNAASRIHAGVHFRTACEVGLDMGRAVGEYVFENALQAVRM